MINFRFHLISLVAVFLALAIGIVVGSTVIDRAIVDGLRNRIDAAERNSIERKVDNERLSAELKQQNSQSTVLAAHAVRGYLEGHSVYVLTIGDVSDSTRVEILELSSVAKARKSSVIRFSNDFLAGDKTGIAEEIAAFENVSAFLGENDNPNDQIIDTLQIALSAQAGVASDPVIDSEGIINSLANNGVLSQEEKSDTIEPAQPVSFIVLINRSALDNENTVSFVQSLYSRYPVTIGLEGNKDSLVSRNKAVELLGSQISDISVVDNIETPTGRTSLIIAHRQNIDGVRQTFGVSSKAQSPAPILLDL